MKALIAFVVFLGILAGSGCLVLWIFSKLTGVDMFEAFAWGFRTKRPHFVLPMLLLHLMAVVFLMTLFRLPIVALTMPATERGGLSGYVSGPNRYVYYDVQESAYREITHYNPPPVPPTLDTAPDVVSYYRSRGAEHYENVSILSLPSLLIFFVLSAISVFPQYFALLAFAREYVSSNRLARDVSGAGIREAFEALIGLRPWIVGAAVLLTLVILVAAGSAVAGRILTRHRDEIGPIADTLRDQLVRKLPPGSRITGKLVGSTTRTERSTRYVLSEKYRQAHSTPKLFTLRIYMVELTGVADIPVYLAVELPEEARTEILPLERFLKDGESSGKAPEIELVVNDDLTLSLTDTTGVR